MWAPRQGNDKPGRDGPGEGGGGRTGGSGALAVVFVAALLSSSRNKLGQGFIFYFRITWVPPQNKPITHLAKVAGLYLHMFAFRLRDVPCLWRMRKEYCFRIINVQHPEGGFSFCVGFQDCYELEHVLFRWKRHHQFPSHWHMFLPMFLWTLRLRNNPTAFLFHRIIFTMFRFIE